MQSKHLSRREFLALAGAAGSAALLAACAPAATPEAPEATEPPAEAPEATEPPAEATEVPATEPPAAEAKTITCWLSTTFNPTEWTTRSAEHPLVINASRILAERFMELHPNIEIEFVEMPIHGERSVDYPAWLTPLVATGEAPDLVWSVHDVPVQNGWALPIGEYLDQPNPFAPEYPRWRDIFYESYMTSLIYADGREYCAPILSIWPNLEVGLAYNKELFDKYGLEPPTTWTEEREVACALKELGDGLSPWWREGESGNLWPLALQILPTMMQELCVEMDLNGDFFVGADEALPAFRAGLIGPETPIYRRGFQEMYQLAQCWVEGFQTIELDLLFRTGGVAMQYRGTTEFSQLANDPSIEFERGFLPSPMPNSEDIPPTDDLPGALDPVGMTAGDGKMPADLVRAVQGPDLVILKGSVEAHDNLEETLLWWQFITTPENNGFMLNENQQRIPSAKDAPLGPLWQEIGQYKLPIYEYSIAWWGQGFYWDATNFMNWRKVFVGWVTDQYDEEGHIERQQLEYSEGADRYEAAIEELEEE